MQLLEQYSKHSRANYSNKKYKNLALQLDDKYIYKWYRWIDIRKARMRRRRVKESKIILNPYVHPHPSNVLLTITGKFLLCHMILMLKRIGIVQYSIRRKKTLSMASFVNKRQKNMKKNAVPKIVNLNNRDRNWVESISNRVEWEDAGIRLILWIT